MVFTGLLSKTFAWSQLNSGTNKTLYDICFVSDSTGFAVGDSGTILKTTNAGKTWIALSSGTSDILRSVFFVNSLVGYVAGGSSTTATVLKTTNAGNTWTALNTGITKQLYDIYFTAPLVGYAVGSFGKIIKTVDGGQNWTDLPNIPNLGWYSLHFFNSNEGIVVGRSSKIIKTYDGGQTWEEITSPVSGIFYQVQFVNSQTGFIPFGNKILKTTDGGNNWTVINTNISFNGLFFLNEQIGFVYSSFINKTVDGGTSWYSQSNNSMMTISSMCFVDNMLGYAVAGSTILKTNIGGGNYSSIEYAQGNNIKAQFNIIGGMFWDMIGSARFEIPNGSGHNSIFASDLWLGGKDGNGQLHLFGNRYNTNGFDLFPGPIMDSNYCEDEELWTRIWKLNRAEIEYHIANWATPGYQMSVNISEWPGNGDVSKGQTAVIAPYFDSNQDGLYTPQYGDYPIIKGDNALFFVMNDSARMHTESGGLKMGVEIRTMVYSFNCPGDSALWNTLFLNYEILNRSQNTYDSTYFGFFADFDLGDAQDDYVGCDVSRSSFYVYNGDANDGDGQGLTYGINPPAQSVTFLGGPTMDADGSDYGTSEIANGCDESINGLGFNDGIIDNERLGMTNFIYFNNSGSAMGDPYIAEEYYNYMNSRWKDGTHMIYGCGGHLYDSTLANFMFPGTTDICGFGTEGIPQSEWSEITCGNPPDDRRGVGAMGPFTMLPGSVHNVDIAFVFGRDFTNPSPLAGVVNMQQRIDSVRKYFKLGQTPCGTFNIGVNENKINSEEIIIYPNPAQNYFVVKAENINEIKSIRIYTLEGTLVSEYPFTEDQTRIYTEKLANGMYIVELSSKKSVMYKKVIVAK